MCPHKWIRRWAFASAKSGPAPSYMLWRILPKTKQVFQIESGKIWNDIKKTDDFQKRVECLMSHFKILRNKGCAIHVFIKINIFCAKREKKIICARFIQRRINERNVTRAGLKPMQPMQLHWAPRLCCPAPWCLGRLFIFAGYTLRLRIQQKRHINFNVNKERSRQN